MRKNCANQKQTREHTKPQVDKLKQMLKMDQQEQGEIYTNKSDDGSHSASP